MKNVKKQKYDFDGEEWEAVDKKAIDLISNMIKPERDRYTSQ